MIKHLKKFLTGEKMFLTREKWISVFLAVLTFAVFAGVMGNDFVDYDDHEYVTRNDHVQAGLTMRSIQWAFTSVMAANWHPITALSHMLDCQIYGLNPAGHHLTNLFFHMANVLLLFLLLREATGRLWESALIAALFALHPLHVESVAWVSERKDVLSVFFCMLSLLMYVRYVKERRTGMYWLSIVFFIFGLLSKPMLVTLPLLLLLMDYWPMGRIWIVKHAGVAHLLAGERHDHPIFWQVLLEKVPYLACSLLFSIITLVVQSQAGAVSTLEAIPLKMRIANALVSYLSYLGKIFYPADLAIFYPHPFTMPPLFMMIGVSLVLAGVTALVCLFARRLPFMLVGWSWYLISLLPVIGIIQVGLQAMADRYAYLPAIGIYILAVFGMSAWTQVLPKRRLILFCLTGVILTFLSLQTIWQVGYWKNTKTLFSRSASVTSRNWLAHGIMSGVFWGEGNPSLAEAEARKALAFSPGYADGHVNLAAVLQKTGRDQEAMAHLREALRFNPKQAQAYINMGQILVAVKEKEAALASYAKAEEFIPRNSWAYNMLGIAYATAGDYGQAMIQFRKAIELAPKRADTYNNIGMVLNNMNRPREALPYLLRAVELQPAFVEAYNNTGVALMKMEYFEKAVYYFSAALLLKPDYEKGRINLYRLTGLMTGQLERHITGDRAP